MPARDQAVGLVEIAAQLISRAGLAGVVARGGDSTRQLAAGLEASDVIALPAVQAQSHVGQGGDRRFGIDAEQGVAFPGNAIRLSDLCVTRVFHGLTSPLSAISYQLSAVS